MPAKILLPQEIETFYVLPTIRRYLTLYLKEQKMPQKDIAAIFGVNTAAISQYHSKRGHKLEFSKEILTEIKKSAQAIRDPCTYLRETQRLLRIIRSTKTLCQIHHQLSPQSFSCNAKQTGCQLD